MNDERLTRSDAYVVAALQSLLQSPMLVSMVNELVGQGVASPVKQACAMVVQLSVEIGVAAAQRAACPTIAQAPLRVVPTPSNNKP